MCVNIYIYTYTHILIYAYHISCLKFFFWFLYYGQNFLFYSRYSNINCPMFEYFMLSLSIIKDLLFFVLCQFPYFQILCFLFFIWWFVIALSIFYFTILCFIVSTPCKKKTTQNKEQNKRDVQKEQQKGRNESHWKWQWWKKIFI